MTDNRAAVALRTAVEKDVVFGHALPGTGRELKGNLYTPHPEAPTFQGLPDGRRAGLVLVHGGGWVTGDRMQLDHVAKMLGRAGYVCFCAEYRLGAEAKWPAMLHDCKAAVRWMRSNAARLGVSPDHIGVLGNSAGGHLSLMLGGVDEQSYPELEGGGGHPEVSSKVAACCAVYPVTTVASELIRSLITNVVMPRDATGRDLRLFCPVSHASPSFPPTCLIHGNSDEFVPVSCSFDMYEALHSKGAHVELHINALAPHGFDMDPPLGRQTIDIERVFFDRIFRAERQLFPIDPLKRPGSARMPTDALGSIAPGRSKI